MKDSLLSEHLVVVELLGGDPHLEDTARDYSAFVNFEVDFTIHTAHTAYYDLHGLPRGQISPSKPSVERYNRAQSPAALTKWA